MVDETPPDLEAEIRQLIGKRTSQQQNSLGREISATAVQEYFELLGAAQESERFLKLLRRIALPVESARLSASELIAIDDDQRERLIEHFISNLDDAIDRMKFAMEFVEQTITAGSSPSSSHRQAVEAWESMKRLHMAREQEQSEE